MRSFHKYRGESSLTLPELIAVLREQIAVIVPRQTKYHVTDVPTERTIRFYTAQGLVDKPLEREGTRAVYGYRHLLQVLAVKYLQSHYLPLVKIRSLVENVSNRDLELLIPEIPSVTGAHRGFVRADRLVPVQPPAVAPAAPSPATPASAEDPRDDAPEGPHADTWHRLEVAPGIELHVYTAALSAENRERLRGVLLREIGVLRGWFEGQG